MVLRNIKPVSYFKGHLKEIMARMAKNHEPIIVTQNGEAAGVFIDVATWEKQQKALGLMRLIMEGEQSIKKAGVVDFTELTERLDNKYAL